MLSHSFSSCVFHILSFLFHFFPTFFPQAMTALVTMRNDILWRCSIFQPLPILTPSWEQNVPGVLPAEPLAVLQSWLPPMHVLQGCTPTARAFCRPLPTWLALSLSGTGPSNYKSNYLHKLSQKPRGRNFIYQNTPLSGENDKNLCCIKTFVLLS